MNVECELCYYMEYINSAICWWKLTKNNISGDWWAMSSKSWSWTIFPSKHHLKTISKAYMVVSRRWSARLMLVSSTALHWAWRMQRQTSLIFFSAGAARIFDAGKKEQCQRTSIETRQGILAEAFDLLLVTHPSDYSRFATRLHR